MNMAISGATGFIGTHLSNYFTRGGHAVIPVTRDMLADEHMLDSFISLSDVVINLAGAPINHRWSESYKREIFLSRTLTTRRLVDSINRSKRVKTFISTSAVGCYPSAGCHDDYSESRGESFLSRVCESWENEARGVKSSVRRVITRFGVVLSATGGAFGMMTFSERHGIATRYGNGEQVLSWIGLDDLTRAIETIVFDRSFSGAVNLTAPYPVTNRLFTEAVAEHFHSRFTISLPSWLLRGAMGELSDMLLRGQCAIPARLTDAGFTFSTPDISSFLRSLE